LEGEEVKNKAAIYMLVIAVVVGGVYYVVVGTKKSGTIAVAYSAPTITKQLFADSPMFSFAYQIFPGALSADAKQAMTGFTTQIQTTSDGSTQVTMTATNPEYTSQQYVVKPGYKLYFIEKNPGDDSVSENKDGFLADDTAVLVDAQGYIAN
jgi:hypothetical protein